MSLLLAGPAYAHTELLRASPSAGAAVAPSLAEIRLTFSETLSPGSTFELLTENFQSVPGLASQIEGDMMFAKLTPPLAVGRYTVQWKALGADGHAVEGSYPFRVSAAVAGASVPWPTLGAGVLIVIGLGAVGQHVLRQRRK